MENKKIAVAMAAVVSYMQMQEETELMSAAIEQPGDRMENKKIAAMMGGVVSYMQAEEETELVPAAIQAQAVGPSAPFKIWGISGRQYQMHTRNLMQMKAFHGLK